MLQQNRLKFQEFYIQESKGLFTFYRQSYNYQKQMQQKSHRLNNIQKSIQKYQSSPEQKLNRNRTLTQPKKKINKQQKKFNVKMNYVNLTSPRCAVLSISPKFNSYAQFQLPNLNFKSQIMGSSTDPLTQKINNNIYTQNSSVISNKNRLKNIEDEMILGKFNKQQNEMNKRDYAPQRKEQIFVKRKPNIKNVIKNPKHATEGNNQETNSLLWPHIQKELHSKINKKMLILQQKQKQIAKYRVNQLKLNNPSINLDSKKSIKEIINEYRKKYQSSLNSNLFSKIKNIDKKQIDQVEKSHLRKKQYKRICNEQVFVYREAKSHQKNQWKKERKHCSSIQILKQPQTIEQILQRYRMKSNKQKNTSSEVHNDYILNNR